MKKIYASSGAITKSELIENLCWVKGLTRKEASEFVELTFSEMKRALIQGHDLKITGLGHFYLKDKRGRTGRNPQTGGKMQLAERRVVGFKVSEVLKEELRNGIQQEAATEGSESREGSGD